LETGRGADRVAENNSHLEPEPLEHSPWFRA